MLMASNLPDSGLKTQNPCTDQSQHILRPLASSTFSRSSLAGHRQCWLAKETVASATATVPLLQEFIVKDFLFPSRNKKLPVRLKGQVGTDNSRTISTVMQAEQCAFTH